MLKLKIHYHRPDLPKIEKISVGDWIDLRCAEEVTLAAGEFRLISLGISVQLPEGYEAHMVPRSSAFRRWGILQANSFGVIDNSYSGDGDIWHFPALATRDTCIAFGERICQFRLFPVMEPISFEEVPFLEGKDRGGFGSTGSR